MAMAKNGIALRKAETVLREIEQLHDTISRRAYELFRRRGDLWAGPLADWLSAERQLVWKPAATAGVEAKDLDVQITAEDVLIKANIGHKHMPEEGTVQLCEFNGGQLFRCIHFPEKIDPDSATAEYRNGMLRLTASIAKPAAHKVEVKAA
jgi:HSP20 family molecular chaperone IbpA